MFTGSLSAFSCRHPFSNPFDMKRGPYVYTAKCNLFKKLQHLAFPLFSNKPRLISLLNILNRHRDVAQSAAAAGYHPPLC